MKKLQFLLLLTVTFTVNSELSGQNVHFKQEFDIPGEQAQSISHISTSDGGTLVLEKTWNTMSVNEYLTLIKTNSTGNIQWIKRIGPLSCDVGNVVQSPDSGYFLCYTLLFPTLSYHALKIDANGTTIFSEQIDVAPPYSISSSPQCMARNNGGFYVSCNLFDNTGQLYLWHVFELTPSGAVVWSNCYNMNPEKSFLTDMDTCANGDIALLGSHYDANATFFHCPVITLLAPGGTFLWSKYYSVAGTEIFPIGLCVVEGHKFAITAQTYNSWTAQAGTVCLKADATGNELWTLFYANNSMGMEPVTIDPVDNNCIAMTGHTSSGGFLVKIDSAGLILCSRSYRNVSPMSFDTTSSSVYTMTGIDPSTSAGLLFTSDSCGAGCDDSLFSVAKTPVTVSTNTLSGSLVMPLTTTPVTPPQSIPVLHVTEICTTVGTQEFTANDHVAIYPVPVMDVIHVTSASPMTSAEILDVNGRIVKTMAVNSVSFTWNLYDLADGVYFLSVKTEAGASVRKIIVQH